MPKKTFSIDTGSEPDDLPTFDDYTGPPLTAGVWGGKVVFVKIAQNRNDDDMFKILLRVDGMEGNRAKYNGAVVWVNQNVTEQGAPYLKKFLEAIGAKWGDLGSVVTDESDPPIITKIGKLKLNGENPIVFVTKMGTYQGERRAELARFLPAGTEIADDGSGDDGNDGDSSSDSAPAGKKGKKDKAGKKAKAGADEPPF